MLQIAHPVDSALRTVPATHSLRRRAEKRTAYYEPLMRVSFRHAYYNRDGDACPDLAARPTEATQQLMHALGLLFRDDGSSLSVLYDRSRSDILLSYLERKGSGGTFWTRLSFVLASRSPTFINITDIPIDLDPLEQNFYFSDQAAHVDPEIGVVLNSGRIVSADQLVQLTGAQYQARVSKDILGLAVRAISGEVVLCEPRCVPEDQAAPLPRCLAWLADLPPTTPDRCRDTIYLNFGTLPEDKYAIDYITDGGDIVREESRLYSTDSRTPLAFIDMLFSQPEPGADGIYPVTELGTKNVAIRGVDYVVNFDARTTYWSYYIVPQDAHTEFDDLAIECLAPDPALRFAGPWPVTIANGTPAWRFVSEQPLLLQQQSIYRFRLKGRRRNRRLDDDTLVERLPVASQQVLPTPVESGTRNYSDIYVYV